MNSINKKLLIVVLILVVVIIVMVALIIGFYFGSRNNSATTPVPASPGSSVIQSGTDLDNGVNKGKTGSSSVPESASVSSVTESSQSSVPQNSSSSSSSNSSSQTSSVNSSSQAPESSTVETLTTRQILDSSAYWSDDSGKYGLEAQAKGEFEVLLDDEVYQTTQIITVPEDTIDGFTYNMIMELENYATGVISTVPLYCHQMPYGKGIHIQLMMWDGKVIYLEPSDVSPFAKFAQNP